MTLIPELDAADPSRACLLTIGVFDGVHLGHRALVGTLAAARTRGVAAHVLTFRNNPRTVLNPSARPPVLSTFDERVALLREAGADDVTGVTFTTELSKLSAGEFVDLLCARLGMRGLVVGNDFAMGRGREGTVPVLERLGAQKGFTVEVVTPVKLGEGIVSSSAIRRAIDAGDVADAARMLGRTYALSGPVVRGFQRGRTIGFPTANLGVAADHAVPANGVYVTWAHVAGRRHMAATSIGTRPTFDNGARSVEAYLLDFDGDLYHKEVRLEFVSRLRDELKFDSVDTLLDQIRRDVTQVRDVLTHPGRKP